MRRQRSIRADVTRDTLGVAAVLLFVAACSGGGSVDVGGGQDTDPATADFPIFYVKRTIPENPDDLRQMRDTSADADLFKRDRAAPGATETNITARVTAVGQPGAGTGLFDVKDVDVSADGRKVVFAMRGPLAMNQDEEDPPTWAIWEYDVVTDVLRRVIVSDITAAEGNDVAPTYLPDGRILFSSTRQRQGKAVLLDEGKPQYEAQNEDRNEAAFNLHVMEADGTNIRQISFNQSNDRDPTVLDSGRILWSRWDHAPGNNGIHLYSANPDGTGLELRYGANSHLTGADNTIIQFLEPREMENGRILSLLRPFGNTDFGGDLVIIDTETYVENTQPTLANEGLAGPAQTRATPNEVVVRPGPQPDIPLPSPGGRFNSAFPLWDGTQRILVSWTQCRLLEVTVTPNRIVACTPDRLADPNALPAPSIYSVWMFDPRENTLLPVMTPTESTMITDVVAAQPRRLPGVILDKVPQPGFEADLLGEGVGILNIKSVYDIDGIDTATPSIAGIANPMLATAGQRPARFIRIEKPVSQPDDDVRDLQNAAFGATNFMREILGYAPIEPDGSVRIKVPANVAFGISILDRDGRRISPIHTNWLQVRPAEELTCNGCHNPNQPFPQRSHGRADLFRVMNSGATTTGQPFPGTVATFSPNAGETMAEVRTRTSCSNDTPRCAALNPSANLLYEDVWTDPAAAGRAPDSPLTYSYADASFRTPAPASASCTPNWTSTCRITINYPQHIQPLWDLVRQTFDMNGVLLEDNTCSRAGCHNIADAAGVTMVPASQLDLRGVDSQDVPAHLVSYRELLFTDNEQELNNMGQLVDRLVNGPIDPVTGLPTLVPVPVAPSMRAQNARTSGAFFTRFATGGTHAGRLSPSELRLVSEWLDIGAQYFNNPFDPAAPAD
jgi:hypothetical protein